MTAKWILYGASGAAGRFIATHAVAIGLQPILAGRDAGRVHALAEQLGAESRVAALDDRLALADLLDDVDLLINCAGPFADTAAPLIEACLRTRTHYVDLCSEPLAFADALAHDERAKAAGVLVIPSAGFAVLPADGLARRLHGLLPSGDHLELAIAADARLTRGTVASSLLTLALGPLVRRNHAMVRLARPGVRTIVFGRRHIACATMPSVELAAAAAATEIPNITMYVRALEQRGELLTDYDRIAGLLRAGLELGSHESAGNRSSVWARLTNASGERVEATLDLPEPLAFTATAVCDFVCRVLDGELPRTSGATTLAGLLGPDFVIELPGVGGFGLRRTLRA